MEHDPLEYIRNTYHVPANKNRVVKVGDKYGVITGASGPYIAICLSGQTQSFPYHPTDKRLDYLDTPQDEANA